MFSIYFPFLLLLSHFQFLADVLNIIDIGFSVLHGKRKKGNWLATGKFWMIFSMWNLVASKMCSNTGDFFSLDAGLSADKASGRCCSGPGSILTPLCRGGISGLNWLTWLSEFSHWVAQWESPPLWLPASFALKYHRMVRVGRDLKDHLVPTPLPWAGTSSTRIATRKIVI